MESTTETPGERANVMVSFLMPHKLLEIPTPDDSPEARRAKTRHNSTWLRRWLPTYIGRWAFLFVVLMTVRAAADTVIPWFLDWPLEWAQYACGAMAVGFTGLYLLSSLTEK
jgi:hypothetical protein